MAVAHLKIGKVNFTFVFRHRFERHEGVEKFWNNFEFRAWELGLWYKHNKMVGKKEFKTPAKWKNNLVSSHMIGINLILCKTWIEFNKGGMSIEIDEK